jgi:hypothetical protein
LVLSRLKETWSLEFDKAEHVQFHYSETKMISILVLGPLSHFSVMRLKCKFNEVWMIWSCQVGPNVNNLVPAIHDGHCFKKFRTLASLVQIVRAFRKFRYKGTILTPWRRKFAKIVIMKDIYRRIQNLNNWVWGPNSFF